MSLDETTGLVVFLNTNFSVQFYDLVTQSQVLTGKNQFTRLKILDITLANQLIIIMSENVFQEKIEIQIFSQTNNFNLI